MITRDLAGAFYVTGFDARTFHSSAKEIGAGGIATGNANSTFLGYNPTSCGFNGRIIDRYGLPEFYQSVLVMAAGQALGFDMSSTGVLAAQGLHVNYIGLSVGLDHHHPDQPHGQRRDGRVGGLLRRLRRGHHR